MCSPFEDLRVSDGSVDDDERCREEAARVIDSRLSEGRPPPTDEQLESIGREWADEGLLCSNATEILTQRHAWQAE